MKHFTNDEFKCPCCGQLPKGGMDKNLLNVLDLMRERLCKPITVNSAYRCPDHNEEVGGVPNSQHMQGTAADISANCSIDQLAELAEKALADFGIEGGVGRYYNQEFVHVDTRGYTARWTE